MVGEPDAGNPHVRFDEGTQETGGNAPRLRPTLPMLPLYVAEPCSAYTGARASCPQCVDRANAGGTPTLPWHSMHDGFPSARRHGFRDESGSTAAALQGSAAPNKDMATAQPWFMFLIQESQWDDRQIAFPFLTSGLEKHIINAFNSFDAAMVRGSGSG